MPFAGRRLTATVSPPSLHYPLGRLRPGSRQQRRQPPQQQLSPTQLSPSRRRPPADSDIFGGPPGAAAPQLDAKRRQQMEYAQALEQQQLCSGNRSSNRSCSCRLQAGREHEHEALRTERCRAHPKQRLLLLVNIQP